MTVPGAPRKATARSVSRGVHFVGYTNPPSEYAARCVAAVIAHVDSDGTATLMVLDPSAGQPGAAVGGAPTGPYSVIARRDDGAVVTPVTNLCTGKYHVGGTWHLPPEEIL